MLSNISKTFSTLPLLSICLPTYNRSNEAFKQLKYIVDEINNSSLSDLVEIIISDNNSSDEHHEFFKSHCEETISSYIDIRINYFYQNQNLGLAGNLHFLAEKSCGKFVWFIADDDRLCVGAIGDVIRGLGSNNDTGLLFINHRALNSSGKVVFDRAFLPEHKTLFDVFLHSNTTLMFITACVYRREVIAGVFANEKLRLSIPLYLSFICDRLHGHYFIHKVLIENQWGDTSWSSSSGTVFYELVPSEILKWIKMSDNKFLAIKCFVKYVATRYKGFLRYYFKKYIKK